MKSKKNVIVNSALIESEWLFSIIYFDLFILDDKRNVGVLLDTIEEKEHETSSAIV